MDDSHDDTQVSVEWFKSFCSLKSLFCFMNLPRCLPPDWKQPHPKDFGWTCTDQKLSSLENYRPSNAIIHFSSCSSCIHQHYGNNFFYNTVMSSHYFVGLWSVKLNLLHVEVYQNLERDTLILLHECVNYSTQL